MRTQRCIGMLMVVCLSIWSPVTHMMAGTMALGNETIPALTENMPDGISATETEGLGDVPATKADVTGNAPATSAIAPSDGAENEKQDESLTDTLNVMTERQDDILDKIIKFLMGSFLGIPVILLIGVGTLVILLLIIIVAAIKRFD